MPEICFWVRLISSGFQIFGFVKRILPRRKIPSLFLPSNDGKYRLEFNVEEIANPNSRVSLSREIDPNGMHRLSVAWNIPADFPSQLLRIYETVSHQARVGGLGKVTISEREKERVLERCHAQGGHHMGTARMSATPSSGVVDQNLRVWGTRGLYVVGSAVFPTCGFANPTLTIVALAKRLASHLAAESMGDVSRKLSTSVKNGRDRVLKSNIGNAHTDYLTKLSSHIPALQLASASWFTLTMLVK